MATVHLSAADVVISRVDEADVDDMGSCVGQKQDQRWLWRASDSRSRVALASVFAQRQDEVFLQLKALLPPCGSPRYYTGFLRRVRVSPRPQTPPPRQAARRRRSSGNI